MKLSFSIDANEFVDDIFLQVKRAGREACNANKRKIIWAGERYALHFIREGRGTLKWGDKEIHLKAGIYWKNCVNALQGKKIFGMQPIWRFMIM